MTSFIHLGVPARLSTELNRRGITEPFPIQAAAIPDAIAGRNVLGRGRTGSGKTVAFSLPMLTKLGAEGAHSRLPHAPRGLILAPTRELASQIASTIEPYAHIMGMRVATVFGGVSQWGQVKALRAGVDILVACPGRLEDLMEQGEVYLDRIEMTVIDEADLMADMGFLPGVTRVLEKTPAESQRMLFSATLDGDIDTLVKRFLPDAVLHEADLEVEDEGVMEHRVFLVNTHDDKMALVEHLASGRGKRILFARTKLGAERLANNLTMAGIPALDLHGNLPQRTRDRNLRAFSTPAEKGGVRVLVATDVAARGVHVDDVELVVHVDPPAEHKSFLHRSGRTARAGASGTVVTISLPAQRRDLMGLLRRAEISVPIERTEAGSPEIDELVGEQVERLSSDAAMAVKASAGRRDKPQGGRRGRGGRDVGSRGERGFTRGERSFAPRGERGFSRDERPFARDERPAREDRSFQRGDRDGAAATRYSSRPQRDGERRDFTPRGDGGFNRGNRFGRDDRPTRGERSERFHRDERPAREDRPFNRDERRTERFERTDRFARDDRSFNRGERNDRYGRDDRGAARREFGDRRGSYGQRDDRPFNRDDRFNRADRQDRGQRFGEDRFNRDERTDRFERNDRSFNRDDRFSRGERNERFVERRDGGRPDFRAGDDRFSQPREGRDGHASDRAERKGYPKHKSPAAKAGKGASKGAPRKGGQSFGAGRSGAARPARKPRW